jgi:hypothetical protein
MSDDAKEPNRPKRRADIDAIIQVKHLYGAVIDGIMSGEYAVADLGRVFAEDAEVEFVPSPRMTGLAATKVWVGETVPSRLEFMWHSFSNPMIEIDGDAASGRWLVLAFVKPKGAETQTMTIGSYREHYVRTPEGWRISELVFRRQN